MKQTTVWTVRSIVALLFVLGLLLQGSVGMLHAQGDDLLDEGDDAGLVDEDVTGDEGLLGQDEDEDEDMLGEDGEQEGILGEDEDEGMLGEDEDEGVLGQDEEGVLAGEELGEDEGVGDVGALPTVELRDEEDNAIGDVDFTETRRGRLIAEFNAEGFDPNRQRVAIFDNADICEAPDFEGEGKEILNFADREFFQDQDTFREETGVEEGVLEEDEGSLGEDEDEGTLSEDDEQEGILGEDEEQEPFDEQEGMLGEDDDEELLGEDENEGALGQDDDEGMLGEDEDEELLGQDEDETQLGEDEAEVTGETNEEALEEGAAIDQPLRDADEAAGEDVGGADLGDQDQLAGENEGLTQDNEFFTAVTGFDTNQLRDEDGAAVVVHRGRNARSDIVACGAINAGAQGALGEDDGAAVFDEQGPADEEAGEGIFGVDGDDEDMLGEDEEEGTLEEDEEPFEEEQGALGEEEVTPLADFAGNPEEFENQEITIEDEVGRVFGRSGFTFGEDENEVLAISTARRGFEEGLVQRGGTLRATGEAGVFNAAQFERDFGVTLNERLAGEFEGRPFIGVSPADIETVE